MGAITARAHDSESNHDPRIDPLPTKGGNSAMQRSHAAARRVPLVIALTPKAGPPMTVPIIGNNIHSLFD